MDNDDLYWLLIPLFVLSAVVFSAVGAAVSRKRQKRENRMARRQARRAHREWAESSQLESHPDDDTGVRA
jgi:Mg2+/citrate symporter